MKKSILKKLLALMMAAVLLLLCGCGSLEEGGAVLDEKLEQFMACIEANDKAGAAALAYNQEFGASVEDFFDDLAAYWPATAGDAYTRQSTNVTIRNGTKFFKGQYLVESAGKSYVVDLAYTQDENGAGITMLYANLSEDLAAATTPSGTLQSAAENTPLQWVFLAFRLIFIGFVIFTIVDILRKKPKLYGLWVLAALFYLTLGLSLSETGVRFIFNIGILSATEWLKYPDGAIHIALGLPAGAIAYWCVRSSLLRQKAAREAAMAAWQAQFQPVPQEPPFHNPEPLTTEEEDADSETTED